MLAAVKKVFNKRKEVSAKNEISLVLTRTIRLSSVFVHLLETGLELETGTFL